MKQPARKHRRIPRELRADELARTTGGSIDDPTRYVSMSRPDVVEDQA